MSERRPRLVIFGIGALGMLFGSRLSQVADVTLVGTWPAQIATVSQTGIWVTELDGARHHFRLTITNCLETVQAADFGLILVKSHQTAVVSHKIAQVLTPAGLVITLQNGLGNQEQLAAVLGSERVTVGATAQGATVVAPGEVRHAGAGATQIAALPRDNRRVLEFAVLLNQAGIMTTLVENAVSLVWGKLAVNVGINPLTALFNLPNGGLLDNGLLQHAVRCAAREVAVVAAAQGIALPYADAALHTLEVARATAANISSMLQDVRRAAPTEIEAICGAVVRQGAVWQVPTPMNRLLLHLVQAKEAGQSSAQDVIRTQLQTMICESRCDESLYRNF